MLSDRSLIALCLMYFTQAHGFYFNITWLPTYLARERGLTPERLGGLLAGVFAGLPLILSAVADVLGGLTTDRIARQHGLRTGRCGVGGVSLLVAGIALIVGATVTDSIASALLIAVSGAGASFLLGACWGVCQDIAGPHAGLVSGCMTTAGQIGAVLSPIILPPSRIRPSRSASPARSTWPGRRAGSSSTPAGPFVSTSPHEASGSAGEGRATPQPCSPRHR